jgi:chromosome transmission fidelity protein 8
MRALRTVVVLWTHAVSSGPQCCAQLGRAPTSCIQIGKRNRGVVGSGVVGSESNHQDYRSSRIVILICIFVDAHTTRSCCKVVKLNARRACSERLAMLIPVSSSINSPREYSVIELQGEVYHEDGLKKGFSLGTISQHETVYLQIGYHRLQGKKIILKKPLLIFRKTDNIDVSTCDGVGIEMEALGVIKHKYVFKSRPKALISHPIE